MTARRSETAPTAQAAELPRTPVPPSSASFPKVQVSITGTLVRRHVERLERSVGRDAVQAAFDRLAAEDAEHIRGVSTLGWVPVETFDQFYEAVASAAGRDVTSLHWEIGKACTRDAFRTVWRVLLRLTTDDALVTRTPMFYSRTYDRGRLEAKATGPGRAELTLSEWPSPPRFVRRGLCIGITTVLELAGRRGVSVREEPVGRDTLFVVTWTA